MLPPRCPTSIIEKRFYPALVCCYIGLDGNPQEIRISTGGQPNGGKLVGMLSALWFEDVQSKVPLPLLQYRMSFFYELQRI
jgi:hypothetical protein